jgi:hypothetical protein
VRTGGYTGALRAACLLKRACWWIRRCREVQSRWQARVSAVRRERKRTEERVDGAIGLGGRGIRLIFLRNLGESQW